MPCGGIYSRTRECAGCSCNNASFFPFHRKYSRLRRNECILQSKSTLCGRGSESSKNLRGKQRDFQENKVFSLHVCVQQNMNTIKKGNCNSGEEGTKASLTTTSLYDKSASAKTDILIFCFLFVSTLDFEKYSNFNFPQGLIFFCCRLDLFCEFCFSAFYHCDYYAEGRSPARKKV